MPRSVEGIRQRDGVFLIQRRLGTQVYKLHNNNPVAMADLESDIQYVLIALDSLMNSVVPLPSSIHVVTTVVEVILRP